MTQAEVEKTKATIDISSNSAFKFIASGEVIKFDGFLKVYLESKDDEEDQGEGMKNEEEGMLPKLIKGEKMNILFYSRRRKIQKPSTKIHRSIVSKEA